MQAIHTSLFVFILSTKRQFTRQQKQPRSQVSRVSNCCVAYRSVGDNGEG